jgi:thiol-disulfide isomerase/thioredoxin
MKKLALLFIFVFAGMHAQADKTKFTATIKNRNADSIILMSYPLKFRHTIKINKAGVFTDAFPVVTGLYIFLDGKENGTVYLKNGADLRMNMDAKMFDETMAFTGDNAKENNFIAKRALANEALMESMGQGITDIEAFKDRIEDNRKSLQAQVDKEGFGTEFKDIITKKLTAEGDRFTTIAVHEYKIKHIKGQPSPNFSYENFKGSTTKLSDFKGRYVYIDIWATWCGPCRQQIPFLEKVAEKYKGKNIVFASISVDEAKDHDKWKKLVKEKSMAGVQLIADKAFESDFVQAYGVEGIPRFILIDPQGKVVEPEALFPSQPELIPYLDKLLLKQS